MTALSIVSTVTTGRDRFGASRGLGRRRAGKGDAHGEPDGRFISSDGSAGPVRRARPRAAAFAFRRRRAAVLAPLYLGFAICFMAAYGAAAWTPTMLLLRSLRLTPAALGTWLGPFSMAFAIAGPLIGGALIDAFARRSRHTAKYTMLIVAPLLAIPSGLAIFSPTPHAAMLLVAWSSGVFPIAGTMVFAMLQTIMPSDMRGTSIAVAGLLDTLLGAALGPVLVQHGRLAFALYEQHAPPDQRHALRRAVAERGDVGLVITQLTPILSNTGDEIYPHAEAARAIRPDFAFAALEGGGVDIVDQQPEACADIVAGFLHSASGQATIAAARD